jgi:anti-repressor protein
MNEVQLFNFENHEVRSLLLNNEPWFVGKDVAEVLGYKNTKDALVKHVDSEDKEILKSQNATFENIPNRGITVVNESGLYSLILSSKLPSAKKFKRWVTSEVLPALRKTGQYQVKELSGSELMARALIEAQNVLAAKDKQIEEMKPKALFADAVSASKGSISVGSLAKLLAQNGIAIGQNRLFAWLRDNNFLIKDGKSKNVATQRYIDQGLFELKANVTFENGETKTHKPTTMVTGKGQRYFIDLFLNSQE